MNTYNRDLRDYELSRAVSNERHRRFNSVESKQKRVRLFTFPLWCVGVWMLTNWITEARPVLNWWWGAIGVALMIPFLASFGDRHL